MFIRLRKRKLKQGHNKGKYTLDAILVKSYKENGKVKQKFIAYLSTMKERLLYHTDPINREIFQETFLEEIDQKLNALHLDFEDLERIKRNFTERITRQLNEQ